jgi:hypothetical protein
VETNAERSAVVLGARNLGGAIAERLHAHDWRALAVGRSEGSLARLSDASPRTVEYTAGQPPLSPAKMGDIAEAVEYLEAQSPNGYTHELTITPSAETLLP